MHHFEYVGDDFCAEAVRLDSIAAAVGTPTYVYSTATLLRHLEAFDAAFAARPHLVCYSVKASSNLAVLHLLGEHGAGMDVVSIGEIHRTRLAGVPGSRVVFSGVGKQAHEIEAALDADLRMINVESEPELDLVERVAEHAGKRARIAIRVNPEVDPRTHPYVATGLQESKFGVTSDLAEALYARAAASRWLDVVGIDCHIGSQLVDVEPFVDAVRRVAILARKLRDRGIAISQFDLGGGLGIAYREGTPAPPHPSEYGKAVLEALDAEGCGDLEVVVEPGRAIVGNSGILLCRVLHLKRTPVRTFVVVDAGMNDLVRPALYGSFHEIRPVRRGVGAPVEVDVVGPVCESGDFLARGWPLPLPEPGDLLAVMSAGAYGFVMSSTYNSRPRPAEVLVDGARFRVVRDRETIEDLTRGERI
ncbi:MAG: diaminopimelate decarboxylase [Deltaproteobacteria bacterium]|nr:diaminopimelate decarboxylase [Deltaproteobacteria bacterium]